MLVGCGYKELVANLKPLYWAVWPVSWVADFTPLN